ncbi:MAG: DUF4363 family protein [Clostridia bacterium]|nr:DUF4363 family protein [Clostridia bacterium]
MKQVAKTKYTLFITFFVLLTLSTACTALQKPISDNRGTAFFINKTETSIRAGNWGEAGAQLKNLDKSWKKDRDRLKNKKTTGQVKVFDDTLSDLKKAIKFRDKREAMRKITILKNTYRNITAP